MTAQEFKRVLLGLLAAILFIIALFLLAGSVMGGMLTAFGGMSWIGVYTGFLHLLVITAPVVTVTCIPFYVYFQSKGWNKFRYYSLGGLFAAGLWCIGFREEMFYPTAPANRQLTSAGELDQIINSRIGAPPSLDLGPMYFSVVFIEILLFYLLVQLVLYIFWLIAVREREGGR